jgi:hypothetical protein
MKIQIDNIDLKLQTSDSDFGLNFSRDLFRVNILKPAASSFNCVLISIHRFDEIFFPIPASITGVIKIFIGSPVTIN